MAVFGTGDSGNAEGVAIVFAAFMDRVGEALGLRSDAIELYSRSICKVILGGLGRDLVKQFGSVFEGDGKFEEVVSSWDVEGPLKSEFLSDGFAGGKEVGAGPTMVGEGDFRDVVEVGRAREI